MKNPLLQRSFQRMLSLLTRNHTKGFVNGAVLEDTKRENIVQVEIIIMLHKARNLMDSVAIVKNMVMKKLIVTNFKRKDCLQ